MRKFFAAAAISALMASGGIANATPLPDGTCHAGPATAKVSGGKIVNYSWKGVQYPFSRSPAGTGTYHFEAGGRLDVRSPQGRTFDAVFNGSSTLHFSC